MYHKCYFPTSRHKTTYMGWHTIKINQTTFFCTWSECSDGSYSKKASNLKENFKTKKFLKIGLLHLKQLLIASIYEGGQSSYRCHICKKKKKSDDFFDPWDPSFAALLKEVCGLQEELLKNKPHLVTFHGNILVSLWSFQMTSFDVDKFYLIHS